MANNKVQLANGTVLIDLTDTTATAPHVEAGLVFLDAAGVKREGTLVVDETYSITKTLTNVSSSADDTKVIAGNSFFTELIPTSGYTLHEITVTMGGVDITDQVFKPGTGSKAIISNGTYNASDDSLSGYEHVVVNVPTETTPTGTKQISITQNGTTTEDVAAYANAEITVNVQGGGTPITTQGIYDLSNGDSVTMSGVNAKLKASVLRTLTNQWDFKTSLTDSIGGLSITLANGATRDSNGITISDTNQYATIPLHFTAGKTYELDIASMNKTYSGTGHGRLFMFTNNEGFIKQSANNWNFYMNSSWNPYNGGNTMTFGGKTLRFSIEPLMSYINGTTRTVGIIHLYVDGVLWFEPTTIELQQTSAYLTIGASSNSMATMVVTGFRAYDGWL